MSKNYKYHFHNNIKIYRLKKGLSQIELAKRCDTTQNTISSLENQQFQPTAYHAGLLCKALDVFFEDLFIYE